MANWKTIMANYESNDCESLGEYAYEHMVELLDYFKASYPEKQAADYAFYCAIYFVNIDKFCDGAEEDVLRVAVADYTHDLNFNLIQKNFDRNGLSSVVENLMRRAPSRIREVFARLGCAICSAKGYISDTERKVILGWV